MQQEIDVITTPAQHMLQYLQVLVHVSPEELNDILLPDSWSYHLWHHCCLPTEPSKYMKFGFTSVIPPLTKVHENCFTLSYSRIVPSPQNSSQFLVQVCNTVFQVMLFLVKTLSSKLCCSWLNMPNWYYLVYTFEHGNLYSYFYITISITSTVMCNNRPIFP